MTNTSTPLLILTCAACKADMLRSVAAGLLVTDGAAIVADGHSQQCGQCGHVHEAGSVIKMRVRRVV